MDDIDVRYVGGDRFLIEIRGHDVLVDQPRSEGGDDAGPTPTELFAASLTSCVGFYAERFLLRHALPTEGLRVGCRFAMSEDRPARVRELELTLHLPPGFPASRRPALRAVVEHCTVHNSIRTAPDVRIDLVSEEAAA